MTRFALQLLILGAFGSGALAPMAALAQDFVAAEPAAVASIAPEAEPLPPGLASARILPGWELPNGNRMIALELWLEPGWKTYWRSPGDAGIPASFDWSAVENFAEARMHWPTPEVIDSGGMRTLGYHDRLVLPIEITAEAEDQPLSGHIRVDLGLCETICVPGHLKLDLPEMSEESDPLIEVALEAVPVQEGAINHCKMTEIRDGQQLTAVVAVSPGDAQNAAALEYDGDGVWVSEPQITVTDGQLHATADFIDETGKPFDLDKSKVRLTLIDGPSGLEFEGCN